MAQACSVSHAENKRSLPAWMLKACSVNQVPKTEDLNKQALESSVKIEVAGQAIPIKRKTGRRLKNVDSEGASELVGLQRCEGREKLRRKRVQDEVEEIRDVTIKKERKASEGAALKNNRKRKLENVKSEASSPVSIDDIELTVEDLVSIAEEYVNADKEQHELEAVKSTRHKEHFPCPTISTEADAGVSVVNGPPVKEGLFQCTTVARNTRSSEHRGDENKSHQELPCPSSLETTEDVAQDMLNLFLGHLWSKPAGNAKKSEPVESVNRTMDNHVPEETGWHSEVPKLGDPVKKFMPLGSMTPTINHLPEKKDCHSELPKLGEPVKKSMSLGSMNTAMNHMPEKKDWRSELPKLGEPVITKKKSSLRDKAALFF